MIEVNPTSEGDRADWDNYVRGHPQRSPYHLQAWMLSIEDAYRHKGFGLMARDSGRLVGILPLMQMRSPLGGGSKIVSLPFCDVGGCLSDDPEASRALRDAALSLARETGATSLEFRESADPGSLGTTSPEAMKGRKFRMLLDLPGVPDELWNGFKSKLRSQIRKAEKNGLSYSIGRQADHIDGFYRVFAHNMHNLGSPVHPKRLFKFISSHYAEDMFVSLVMLEDRVVGAGLVLLANGVATIPWASTVPKYNNLAPNMLLYWSVLKRSIECGSRRFDFGRSTYDEGTYRFKQQWGAFPVALDWQSFNATGDRLEAQSGDGTLRKFAVKAWQRMPLSIANLLGPLIRRHISL